MTFGSWAMSCSLPWLGGDWPCVLCPPRLSEEPHSPPSPMNHGTPAHLSSCQKPPVHLRSSKCELKQRQRWLLRSLQCYVKHSSGVNPSQHKHPTNAINTFSPVFTLKGFRDCSTFFWAWGHLCHGLVVREFYTLGSGPGCWVQLWTLITPYTMTWDTGSSL